MNKNHYRALVIFTFLLTILSIVYDFFYADAVTKKLFAYQEIIEPDWSAAKFYLVSGAISVAVFSALAGVVGLVLFWNIARHLFLLASVLLLAVTPFMGPYVASGLNQTLYSVVNLLSGLILGLVYFSPLKSHFMTKTKRIRPNPGG